MHPEAVVRLRNEILEKVGPTRCPTYEDIREMKYLRAVINGASRMPPMINTDLKNIIDIHVTETLRLFPPVYASD